MPERSFSRDQVFLLPPRLDEWISPQHPARFLAAWLDDLPRATWTAMGIALTPADRGEARYAPQALLAIWVYGFMVGIRSTRALEVACRDQLPFRWLSGNQTPDHNTLSRFYRAHRQGFHHLFHASIERAVTADLVDWGLQAVDGTKLWANASGDRNVTAEQLASLAAQVEAEIAQLETEDPTSAPAVARRGQRLVVRQRRIQRAQARIAEGRTKGNVTDPDAHQMTARGVNRPSYNAQAVVRGLHDGGRMIVAIAVDTRANDHGQLETLALQASVHCGQAAAVTVADAGYHDSATLAACDAHALPVVISLPARPGADGPFGPDAFVPDPATGGLRCPEGVVLRRWNTTSAQRVVRYGAPDRACRVCQAKAQCCPGNKRGRVVARSPHHAQMVRHREQMARPDCQAIRRRRKGLIEGVFGTLKTRHGARQCLLRGLASVQAEWTLLATAFNLRTLSQRGGRTPERAPASGMEFTMPDCTTMIPRRQPLSAHVAAFVSPSS